MKRILSNRIPAGNDILLLFAFTAFLIYGRTLFIFVWKLPSWLKLLTVNEMLPILSYSFSFNLLETAGVVLALLVIGFILPPAWFRNSFVVRGVWTVFVILVSLMILLGFLNVLMVNISNVLVWWTGATVVLAVLAAFAAPRLRLMRSAALWFAEQTIIFLFLLMPASLIGLIVVAARNIF
jgi:hypothetical protein